MLTLLFCVISQTSCGPGEGPGAGSLEGRWKCVRIGSDEAGPGGSEYVFEGRKLTIKQGGFEKRADILKMSGNTFPFRYEGGQAEAVFEYTLQGTGLLLKPRMAGGQPLTFEKQP